MEVNFKFAIGQIVLFKNPHFCRDNRQIEEGTISEQIYNGHEKRYLVHCMYQCATVVMSEEELVAKGEDIGLMKFIPLLQEIVCHIKERTVGKQHFELLISGGKVVIDL